MKHTAWSKEELEYVRDCRERPAPSIFQDRRGLGRLERLQSAVSVLLRAVAPRAKDSHYNVR